MILTDDDELAEVCRSLRNLCFLPEKRFVHERLGWNLRMTNLQAALGLSQLERLDDFIELKRWMGARYTELFAELSGIQLPLERTAYAENIYWVFGLVLNESMGLDAAAVMQRLGAEGVGTRPFFYPLHQQPVLHRKGALRVDSCPVAERLYRQGFYVPSGLAINEKQVERVATVLRHTLLK